MKGDDHEEPQHEHGTSTRLNLVRSFVAAVSVGLPLVIGAPVSARTPVDPSSLNPPLPDFFNGVCNQLGNHILCTLCAFSDDPITDEPSGVVCDGTEILYSQKRAVVGKRTYTGAGDLLQRHFRAGPHGHLLEPRNGRVLRWVAQSTIIDNLAVPGDRSTGVIQITGTATRVFTTSGRTVLNDAGRVVIDAVDRRDHLHRRPASVRRLLREWEPRRACTPLCAVLR